MKTVGLALALVVGFNSPAVWSQPERTEQEIEQLSRQVAIDAVKLSAGLRWRPGEFPLRVAFDAGVRLKEDRPECYGAWQERYESYLQFINAGGVLLVSSDMTKDVDAFVFFGSNAELDALPAWRLQQAWWWKPGSSVLSQWLDRYSHSYREEIGTGQFVEFSAAFFEVESESLFRCEPLDAVGRLGGALLSDYNPLVVAQADRLFKGLPPPTFEWRTHRRLLAAMTRLPEEALTSQLVKTFLIRELAND